MKVIINKYYKIMTLLLLTGIVITSCGKDDYYIDGGKANPTFNGTVMDYLESDAKFDTIAQIVKLAGMEDVFKNEEITFFAPTDEIVRRTIGTLYEGGLNSELFRAGKDTIKTLSDVSPQLWRKYLTRYVYKGKRVLKDYPQIDFGLTQLFPGGYYFTYDGELSNIGVVYNPVNGVKYTGYRQLALSYIYDSTSPQSFMTAAVATSDIQPSNGAVHVLAIYSGKNIGELILSSSSETFGFGFEFMEDVLLSK